MTGWFSNLSIRSKLMLAMAASTTLALMLAATAISVYDIVTFRRALAQKLTTVAEIVGRNTTAALAFSDSSVASDLLGALGAEPSIVEGVVFDASGRVFARYGATPSGVSPPRTPGEVGSHFEGRYLVVVRAIELDQDRVGTVYIRAALSELSTRQLVFSGVTLAVVSICSLIALLFSALLQRRISGPILDLAETARRVSSEGNFSLRAPRAGRDEVGALVEDFNRMLTEIEDQDQRLRTQQEQLTTEVANRTAELVAANRQLTTSMERVERYADQIAHLTALGQLLQSCHTQEEVFGVVQQAMERLFPRSSGALTILRASGNLMESMAVWGASPPGLRVFGPEECWAYRRSRPHAVADARSPLRCLHRAGEDPGVAFCVPMIAQGETVGILQFNFERADEPDVVDSTGAINSTRARLAIALSEQIALALTNLRLREALRNQSVIDPLTGLFNRRYLLESLDRECRRALRMGRPLSILMIDVDHFKRFNDTWGHDGGDAVMRELAALMRTHFRGDDIACRYGGEEFVLVLAEASSGDALVRAEEFRVMVQRMAVHYRNQSLGGVTISIGLASIGEHGVLPEQLIAAADVALYEAKSSGRNRTVIASAGVGHPAEAAGAEAP
jgi:diguanylate cyclase (GGDEF)-like protein